MTPATLSATRSCKIEDVFKRAVEAVGPEMGAVSASISWRGDAHPVAAFAH